MERKTDNQLLTEYIEKNYSWYDNYADDEFRNVVYDSYGFASYKMNYNASILGDTIKDSLQLSIDKAKEAFENLSKQLKDL